MKEVYCVTALVETSPQALPLGSACIASAVKNYKPLKNLVDVKLKTFSLESKKLSSETEDFLQELNHAEFPLVLFSVYVWNRDLLENLAQKIKEKFPALILIAGGPEVTANPFSFKYFDYAVCGEGEGAVPALIYNLISHADFTLESGVYNLHENNDGKIISRAKSLLTQDLPSPYLDGTLDPSLYGGALWELARGCPFKCSYCYESKGEKSIKYFPMERITKELELFNKKNVRQVFVLDPTYNASKKRALEMLSLIKSKTSGMFFYFEARAEYIDRELAKAFSKIPCSLQFGLQSAHENVLKTVNRTVDRNLISKNIGYLNQEGVVFGFDLIYGLPNDSLAGFKSSIDYAISLYPNNLELFCLSVLPGTVLYEQGKELGLVFQSKSPYNVIENKTFSREEIGMAKNLSSAVDFFYNKGRAVPWFLTVLYPLHIKPSVFFSAFLDEVYLKNEGLKNFDCEEDFYKIMEIQKSFIEKKYRERHLEKYVTLINDIISLQGALSYATSCGKESVVNLHYHPDDLMSEYSTDLAFFYKNAGTFKNRTKVFVSKNGPDWAVLK